MDSPKTVLQELVKTTKHKPCVCNSPGSQPKVYYLGCEHCFEHWPCVAERKRVSDLEAALKDESDTERILTLLRDSIQREHDVDDSDATTLTPYGEGRAYAFKFALDRIVAFLPQSCKHCNKTLEEHATVSVHGRAGGVVVCTPIKGFEPK